MAEDRSESFAFNPRSEEHTYELQSHSDLVCRLLLEKKTDKTYVEKSGCTDEQKVSNAAPARDSA